MLSKFDASPRSHRTSDAKAHKHIRHRCDLPRPRSILRWQATKRWCRTRSDDSETEGRWFIRYLTDLKDDTGMTMLIFQTCNISLHMQRTMPLRGMFHGRSDRHVYSTDIILRDPAISGSSFTRGHDQRCSSRSKPRSLRNMQACLRGGIRCIYSCFRHILVIGAGVSAVWARRSRRLSVWNATEAFVKSSNANDLLRLISLWRWISLRLIMTKTGSSDYWRRNI